MIVRRHDNFDFLRQSFPELARHNAGNPFETLDWYELLARYALPENTDLLLLTASSENHPPLFLPLIRQGGELASLSNYYTGIYGPLGRIAPDALDAACRYLRQSSPKPTIIRFQPLDPQGKSFTALQQALTGAGYLTDSYFCFGNWHLSCAGKRFADYIAQRPSALRNTIRRGRRHLDQAGQWSITVHTREGEDLERAIANYESIYRKSWKPTETYPDFIRSLCRLAARRGWLRLGVLSLESTAIASQIWLFDNGTAYIFKLAYDPAAARFSPGSVLTAAMFAHTLDHDQATEIDYLSGDDAYKRDWMSQRRERHGLVAFDPATPRGLALALRHYGGKLWQRLKS
jgi:CelD/BcsL family acetyltransferase involved in cellulose biosynthesis